MAAGVLAAVGVEGRVAGPEGRRRVADRGLRQRREGRPVVGTLAGEGDMIDDAVDALDLAAGVVAVWRAEDECRPVREALAERVSRSETSTPGSPASRSTDATKLRASVAAVSAAAALEVGTGNTRPVRRSMLKFMAQAGAGDGQLEEVEADTSAEARGDWQREQQAGRRQVVGLVALTRRAGAHVHEPTACRGTTPYMVLMYTDGMPGHHTERRARASVLSRP